MLEFSQIEELLFGEVEVICFDRPVETKFTLGGGLKRGAKEATKKGIRELAPGKIFHDLAL